MRKTTKPRVEAAVQCVGPDVNEGPVNRQMIVEMRAERKRIAEQRRELAKDSQDIKENAQRMVQDAAMQALQTFMEKMGNAWDRSRYVHGGFTSVFTKFFKRNSNFAAWHGSERYRDALHEFNRAKEKLNDAFATEIVENDRFRSVVISTIGYKGN